MAMDESYLKALAAFRERGNYQEVFVNVLSKIFTVVKLGGIRSCLAIGPGDGWYEIEFLKHCEANISKFIGIEPDHASAEHLRRSLRSSLPGAESEVFETTVQTWEGPSVPVDLITMFHVSFFVPAGDRQEFLKKVRDSWLVSGGYVAVVKACHTNAPNGAHVMFERLGAPHTAWEEIEADFLNAGFTKHYAHEIHVLIDLTSPDENLIPLFQPRFKKGPLTLDILRDACKGLEAKSDEFHIIAVFKRTD